MFRRRIFDKRRGYGPNLNSSFRVEGFFQVLTQRLHVVIGYILGLQSRYMGTLSGPKYIPYTYMDPLGEGCSILIPHPKPVKSPTTRWLNRRPPPGERLMYLEGHGDLVGGLMGT